MQQHAADAVAIAKRAAAEMRAVGVISSDIESPRRDEIPAVSDPKEFGEMADTGLGADDKGKDAAPATTVPLARSIHESTVVLDV
jgi:hypothetical protein